MLFLGAERTECHSVKSHGDSSQQSVTAKRRDESSASASSRRIGESTILLTDAEHSVQLWCPICQNLRVC